MAQFGAVAMGFLVGYYFEGEDREDLSENQDDGEMHLWDRNWCDGWVRSSSVDGSTDGSTDG